ncbi:MAG TPA: ATP-binding protein, partial [Solirubrobacter sp.]|nr:ATP-binding protein [Solirubrobacter sp.]
MSEGAGQLAPDEWRDVGLGDSEMALRVHAFDWAATPLGPLREWPSSLRAVVGLVLRSPAQMTVYWGPELTCIYNDAERDIIGDLHPRALGQPARELLRDSWDVLEPQLAAVLAGRAILLRDEPLRFDRHGAVQLGWFTYSYSPIPDDDGGVGGVLLVSDETTAEVLGRRRMDCLQALGAQSLDAVGAKAAAAAAAAALDGRADTPFALVYLADGADATHAAGAVGAAPRIMIEPSTKAGAVLHELADERPSGMVVPAALFADAAVRDAYVAPLSGGSRDALAGFLIAGLSDDVPFDDAYRDFMANVARVIGRSLAAARARADERERSRSLEALGRARTALFSNAAHELRTPLTLILGAIDQLDDADAQVARRSALRMLELVNALLDVSRIEAGEPLGVFEPTDLAALTREVAGMFGQAARGAGLSLLIGCPPLDGPVYVDRESWERIVSNLLSNAIKYTPAGSVRVGLAADGGAAVLTVEDTGIGIPPRDRERVFSRFYRVVDNRARTSGGTGIGLALVRRLVELHAGTVRAEGAGDGGTRLVVRIPFGHAHLGGRVAEQPAEAPPIGDAVVAYVAEAEGWLDERAAITTPRGPERALVIDDNADMRAYLRRLLAPHYAVEAAADGLAGLAAAVAEPPTVIISDVMLPGLDGMALLRSLRQNAAT